MNLKYVVALAAIAAAPAFAQGVTSSSSTTVTTGTGGPVVAASSTTTTTATATAPAVGPSTTMMIPGGVMAQADSSETVNGNTRTVVTRYWANVPPDVQRHAGFQRWQALR